MQAPYSVAITNSVGATNSNPATLTVNGIGNLVVNSVSNGVITLSWLGGPQTRLQSRTNLISGAWQDVTNTLGQSMAVLPIGTNQMFFRLLSTPSGIASSLYQLANASFEADGSPAASPTGWSTIGNAAADSVISSDAYSGTYSLQHSNSIAYQALIASS